MRLTLGLPERSLLPLKSAIAIHQFIRSWARLTRIGIKLCICWKLIVAVVYDSGIGMAADC